MTSQTLTLDIDRTNPEVAAVIPFLDGEKLNYSYMLKASLTDGEIFIYVRNDLIKRGYDVAEAE